MDAERLEYLLRALPPAPEAWVADALDLVEVLATTDGAILDADPVGDDDFADDLAGHGFAGSDDFVDDPAGGHDGHDSHDPGDEP